MVKAMMPSKLVLVASLKAHEGSTPAVAKYFGVSRKTVGRWITKLGLRASTDKIQTKSGIYRRSPGRPKKSTEPKRKRVDR